MRKFGFITVAVIIAMSMVACGKKDSDDDKKPVPTMVTDLTDAATPEADTDAPVEDTDAPVDDTDTPEEDTDTPEEDNDTPEDGDDDFNDLVEGEELYRPKETHDVIKQVDEFLDAVSTGKMDVVLDYTSPDCDYYEYIELLAENDPEGELFKVLFGRLVWTWTPQNIVELDDSLDYADGAFEEEETILVTMANPVFYMADTYYTATLDEGTEFPDDYDGGDEATAKEIVQTMIDISPLELWDQLDITYADGKVLVNMDDFWSLDMASFEDLAKSSKNKASFRRYLLENFYSGSFQVMKDVPYSINEECNNNHVSTLDAAEKMDYKTIEEIYAATHDEAYLEEEFHKDLKTYDDLSDSEKEYMDNIFANKDNMVRSYYAQHRTEGWIQRGTMVLCIPVELCDATLDEDDIAFAREHNVVETVRLTPPLSESDNGGVASYVYLNAFYKAIGLLDKVVPTEIQ